MNPLYSLVRRMREETLSRNRDFEELSQPLARRARRIDRWLRGLERELRSGASVELTKLEEGYRVSLGLPSLRMRRDVYLTDEELALLEGDPTLRAILTPPSPAPSE